MTTENVLAFYEALGFEEVETEDNVTSLYMETDDAESYALITDEEGLLPASLHTPVIFACYSPAGAILWNVGLKNSYAFKELWTQASDMEEKLALLRQHREQNQVF